MKTILVVEKDDNTRGLMASTLRKAGFLITAVESGEKAIIYLRKSSIDIILLDFILPEMDGLTLLESIRTNPATKDLSVIISSSNTDQNKLQKAGELGINAFIPKPFTRETLAQKVTMVSEGGDGAEERNTEVLKPETGSPKIIEEVEKQELSQNPTKELSLPHATTDDATAEMVSELSNDIEAINDEVLESEINFWETIETKEQEEPSQNPIEELPVPQETGDNLITEKVTIVDEDNVSGERSNLVKTASNMNSEIIEAGKKLESGDFNALESSIKNLSNISDIMKDENLHQYVVELDEIIQQANDARKSHLLKLRSKIHSLNKYVEKFAPIKTTQ